MVDQFDSAVLKRLQKLSPALFLDPLTARKYVQLSVAVPRGVSRDAAECQLNHRLAFTEPHLQRLVHVGEEESGFRLLFQHHDLTLSDQLKQRQKGAQFFNERQIRNVIRSLLSGLQHLAKLGLEHSALSLGSVLVSKDGNLVIQDPSVAVGVGNALQGFKQVVAQVSLLATQRVEVEDWPLFRRQVAGRYGEQLGWILDRIMSTNSLEVLLKEGSFADIALFCSQKERPRRSALALQISAKLQLLEQQVGKLLLGQSQDSIIRLHRLEDSTIESEVVYSSRRFQDYSRKLHQTSLETDFSLCMH